MPRYVPNEAAPEVKRRFFELIRAAWSAQSASLEVGVSPGAGPLWFVDAGQVAVIDQSISSRFLTQDDRIEIADGLGRGEGDGRISGGWGPATLVDRWLEAAGEGDREGVQRGRPPRDPACPSGPGGVKRAGEEIEALQRRGEHRRRGPRSP